MQSYEIGARTRSLPSALYPRAAEAIGDVTKEKALSIMVLTTNLVLDTIKVYRKADYYNDLDPLVGNFGCQNQASQIMDLVRSPRLTDEIAFLEKGCKEVGHKLKMLKSTAKTTMNQVTQLFHEHVAKIEVTDEMITLLQCRALTLTKKCLRDDQGFQTRDITVEVKLQTLSRGIDHLFLREIVRIAKERLSISGLLHVRAEANKIWSIQGEERTILHRMLAEDYLVEVGDEESGKKTFGSTYYTTKAVMLRAMEKQEIIVIKRLTKNVSDSTLPLFYRSEVPGGSLSRLTEEEIRMLDIKTPVLVIEGIYREGWDKEAIAKKIEQHGLYQVVLAAVAQNSQFVPDKPELDRSDPTAEIELREQRDVKAVEYECKMGQDPFLDVIHLACSSVKYEQEKVKGKPE